MAAFRKAVELGADGIELDVHLTADGKLVVIHDNSLDRVAGSPVRVGRAGADELREFDVGSWFTAPDGSRFEGERIPLLSEVLEFAVGAGLWLNVELKAGSRLYPGIEAACVRLLEEYGVIDRVVVSSFDHYALRATKKANPAVAVGVLHASGMIDAHEYATIVGADALHPNVMVVDPQYVAGARSLGMAINVWTVNDAQSAAAMASLGVDSIITDDPVLVRNAIAGIEGPSAAT
jgi:glycerophosphoryl diester phosphodiesterase